MCSLISKLLIACAAVTAGAAKAGAAPRRGRSLSDGLNMDALAVKAEAGQLGSKLLFKIDSAAGGAAAVADGVADILECGDAPAARVFRDAGKQ